MASASHLPGLRSIVNARFARIRGFSRVLALLPVWLMLLAPASVRGDIYKWTDELGNTVISNVPPVKTSRVSDLELLAAAIKPATPLPVPLSPSPRGPAQTDQALQARIENLERQLQAQQVAQEPQMDPQSNYPEGYYPTPVPPPSDPGYYGGYDAGYNPGYYPGYYNPWLPSYSVVVVPARTFARRPGFANRPAFVNRPGFMGRPPVFTGRPPVFTGRPPVFVNRSPVRASQPASGLSRSAAFSGGSMHRGSR